MSETKKVCGLRKLSSLTQEPSTREQWFKAWQAARKFGRLIHTSSDAETFGAMFLLAWQCLLYRQHFSGGGR
ncbi:MAG TPA: hypothetical protein PK693_08345 [Halothiobacillus sp.]|jgi:hypothetical protein|nr:hypothetical protein [Halothiobacillus sp.]